MCSGSVRDPNFSIAGLLSDFRSSISGGALRALEERDDAWRAENRGLREHCRLLEDKIHEILSRSRWLEDKLSEQSTLRQNMAVEFGSKEKWLLEKIQRSEDVLRMVKRDHCVRVDAVASDKALVEEELKKVLGRLSKGEQQEEKLVDENLGLVRKIRVLKRGKARLASEVRRIKLKLKETDRILEEKIYTGAERRRSEEEKQKLLSDFSGKTEALEREKGDKEDKICKYEMEINGEPETVFNKNVALEAESRRLEEENKKIPELVHRVQVLERGKGDIEAECCKIRNENVAVEAERKRLEEENKKIPELVQRVRVLECEKGDIEAECCAIMKEKTSEIERISDDKAALEVQMRRKEEEMKEKISELVQGIAVLQREKEDLEADCCKVMTEKSSEVKWILDDKVALEAQMRRKEEEMNDKISEFAQRIVVLQREKEDIEAGCRKIETEKNGEIVRILDDKGALEVKMRNMEEKISDFVQRIRVLEREKTDTEAKLFEAKREKNGQIERFVKMAVDDEKERSEREVKERVSELRQRIASLEKEKAELSKTRKEQWKMEFREKKAMDSWMEEKKALEAELSKMKGRISKVNRVLEFEKRRVEEEKDNASKLAKRIEVLEQEKGVLKAEVCKAKKDRSNLDEWDRKVNMAVESQKRRMDEAKEMCFLLGNRILALEKAKGVMEAKVSKVNREKSNEIMRVLKDKLAVVAEKRTVEVEYKKKVSELVCRIEASESEKVEFEARICQAEERSEAVTRILNKRKSVEEEKGTKVGVNEKKVSELDKMIDVLKAEKTALADDLLGKDEVIKVLVMENELLVAKKTELEREIGALVSTSKEDMESSQQVLHVGTLGAPGQRKGENNTALVHPYEQKQNSHHGDTGSSYCRTESVTTPTNACKRKHPSKSLDTEDTPFVRCKKSFKEINIPASPHRSTSKSTRATGETLPNSQSRQTMSPEKKKGVQASACTYVSDPKGILVKRDHIVRPQTWVVEQDLLDALDSDRELCLKAVCALYRQHKSYANSGNNNTKGFKPMYESKAIALAEFLIDEDPEGRMKRSVADLEQLDPLAVDECVKIAKEHHKRVFEVYQKNRDPFFLH